MQAHLPQWILPIKLEKSEERLTSLGGLLVLEEMAQGLQVWQRVDKELTGTGSGRGYRPSQLVQPLVWMLPAGGRRLEDLYGNCGPSRRCWRIWGCGRCRMPGRWETGCSGKASRAWHTVNLF
jgi:hypothetical protein